MELQKLKQGERVLQLLQDKYPGYHPLIGVAKIAHSTEDERLEFDCHKTLCDYVEPKLKSVEVQQSFSDDSQLKVIFEGDFEDVTEDDGPAASLPSPLPVEELLDNGVLTFDNQTPVKVRS